MNEQNRQVIFDNIADNNNELSSCVEKRIAHIWEYVRFISSDTNEDSDVLKEIFTSDEVDKSQFLMPDNQIRLSGSNQTISSHTKIFTDDFDEMNFCRFVTGRRRYSAVDINELLFGPLVEVSRSSMKKVGILRNKQSSDAFVLFASKLYGLDATYEDDFKSLCESVNNGVNEFAVIPLWNSADGRIDSLYKMIFRYSFVIKMVAKVESDDGETTYFALVGRNTSLDSLSYANTFEFNLAFDDCSELGKLVMAIKFFGADIVRLSSLPESAGQKNVFGFVIDILKADFAGLLAYIGLYFPRFVPVGIYGIVS